MIEIREAKEKDFGAVGRLTVQAYRSLPGMPGESEMPEYYAMLAGVAGRITDASVKALVAVDDEGEVVGAVMYYGDMKFYGSGGTATQEKNAAGIRLLVVDEVARGRGIGRALTERCLKIAEEEGKPQVILHTTKAMQQAWDLYERIGFARSPDLDFMQGPLPVFGFRRGYYF